MGHNSVVSGHPKSTGILPVGGLSTGPSGFGASHLFSKKKKKKFFFRNYFIFLIKLKRKIIITIE